VGRKVRGRGEGAGRVRGGGWEGRGIWGVRTEKWGVREKEWDDQKWGNKEAVMGVGGWGFNNE